MREQAALGWSECTARSKKHSTAVDCPQICVFPKQPDSATEAKQVWMSDWGVRQRLGSCHGDGFYTQIIIFLLLNIKSESRVQHALEMWRYKLRLKGFRMHRDAHKLPQNSVCGHFSQRQADSERRVDSDVPSGPQSWPRLTVCHTRNRLITPLCSLLFLTSDIRSSRAQICGTPMQCLTTCLEHANHTAVKISCYIYASGFKLIKMKNILYCTFL